MEKRGRYSASGLNILRNLPILGCIGYSAIAELPVGYISKKTIRGKVAHYLQWKEGGKLRSRYIKKGKIDERRALQARLKEIRVDGDAHVSALTDPLRTATASVCCTACAALGRRRCCAKLSST